MYSVQENLSIFCLEIIFLRLLPVHLQFFEKKYILEILNIVICNLEKGVSYVKK